MTGEYKVWSLRRVYWLTASFGAIGFVSYLALQGPRQGFGFLLGAGGSFGNLWLFDFLARSLAPMDAPRQPWRARAFASRYLILFAVGYVIVKALGVNPLAVVLGLLASTVAILIASLVELAQAVFSGRRTH